MKNRSHALPPCPPLPPLLAVGLFLSLAMFGCGHAETHREMEQENEAAVAAPVASLVGNAPQTRAAGEATADAPSGKTATPPAPALPRKIVYTASVDLITEDLSQAARSLGTRVQQAGGYVAEKNISGQTGTQRDATWKVRIPVDHFDSFMSGLNGLGELQSSNTTSQDVSEEFYDTDARLKNKRVEEARLLDHLKHSTAKLTDILAVESEISRVREEIERMEGRMRLLANQSDLTTITVSLHEIKNYVPPQPPTFTTQMTRAFTNSLFALGTFAKATALLAVSLLPWLALASALAVPLWLQRQKRHRPKPTAPSDR